MTRRNECSGTCELRMLAGAILSASLLVGCESAEKSTSQRHFETPEQAVDVLLATLREDDMDGMVEIFGSEHKDVYVTADTAADAESRQNFLREADEKLSIETLDPDTAEIIVGDQEWPLPVPLVREEGGWRFDTAAGADEVISRRVGRNEIWAIELCQALVAAQEYYRANDFDGDGIMDYASRLKATSGRHDGLYWPAEPGGKLSPLHDFVSDEKDYFAAREQGSPVRGYYGKMITQQGPGAPGGTMDFMEDGRLLHGHALILWPAEYGNTGIMTFIASHHGTVYEQDLGDDSADIAAAIDVFDPDETWSAVE